MTTLATRDGHAASTSAPRRRHPGGPSRFWGVARGLALGLIVVAFGFPILWMVLASLKNTLAISDPSQTFIFTPTLENFERVLGENEFGLYIFNSTIVGGVSTTLALVLGVPAAYAVSRYSMGRSALMVLAARVVPGISLLVPWYFILGQIGLVGTYTGVIFAHMFVTLPLVVWIMTGFFDGLPIELEESAQVDGLSLVGAFRRVTLRLAVPGIVTAGLLAFIFSWNNFLFSLVLVDNTTETLPVALFGFISYASIDWGGLMAASTITMLPVVLIALFAQRYIVSGLTAGATKG